LTRGFVSKKGNVERVDSGCCFCAEDLIPAFEQDACFFLSVFFMLHGSVVVPALVVVFVKQGR
jgi:hypothetical protein